MFVLVPSPFLGSSTWNRTAQALQARGRACAIIDLSPAIERGSDAYSYVTDLASRWRFVDPTFVAHSGAGALMPSILTAAANPAARGIFADGLLPHPGRSWFDSASPRLSDWIQTEASGGTAMPWPTWFGPKLYEMLPDADDRAMLEADAPRVPLDFLRQVAPALEMPSGTPCAYLRLSKPYETECSAGEGMGWRVRRMDWHHLSLITEPGAVADALLELDDSLRQ